MENEPADQGADYNFSVNSPLHAGDLSPADRSVSVFSVRTGTWSECGAAARAVRLAVFVYEQNIPVALEWDEWDETALHALAWDAAGTHIGTGRLLPVNFDPVAPSTGHIGRMAVLANARRSGAGSAILQALMRSASTQGFTGIVLHAQSQVVPFYARHGYVIEGEEFIEAGILHRTMRAPLVPLYRIGAA